MPREVKMINSTSVLGSSFRRKTNKNNTRVAALLLAVTFLLMVRPACAASVSVKAEPVWLAKAAERSLTAVLENMAPRRSKTEREKLLIIVSDRLFAGFKTYFIGWVGDHAVVSLIPEIPPPLWKVELERPPLQSPPCDWFDADSAGVLAVAEELLRGLPFEALAWSDVALRNEISEKLQHILPGWTPSLVVLNSGSIPVLRVSFTPSFPLILAVDPAFSSVSLPMLLSGELRSDLLERLYPLIGLPVEWARLHTKEINIWAETYLGRKAAVENTVADARVSFTASQVSKMEVQLESRRYAIGAWAAVYAGTEDRSAELGLHLGRRAQLTRDVLAEFYGEGIVQLQNWEAEGRFGFRFSPWGDVWLGGEWSTEDEMWWGRASIDPRLHKPYAWCRIREDGEVNAALGWKVTEYISLELHYDDRNEDQWGLRMLGNL